MPTASGSPAAFIAVSPQPREYLDCQAVRATEYGIVMMVQLALVGILIALVAIHALNFIGKGE